jgi:hypothetical protein
MASEYEVNKAEIVKNIRAQKNIYKFRQFLYSLNRDIRQTCFRITRDFFENEYNNNTFITATERERLLNLINHWQWNEFDGNSTNWWSTLSFNHSSSLSLIIVINMWVDEIQQFDTEVFETETDGVR